VVWQLLRGGAIKKQTRAQSSLFKQSANLLKQGAFDPLLSGNARQAVRISAQTMNNFAASAGIIAAILFIS